MLQFNSIKNQIPLQVRLFVGKALLFFIVWKIIYSFFLYDSKILDYPLTKHVGEASTFFLNNLGFMDGFKVERETTEFYIDGEYTIAQASHIYHNNKKVLNIEIGRAHV